MAVTGIRITAYSLSVSRPGQTSSGVVELDNYDSHSLYLPHLPFDSLPCLSRVYEQGGYPGHAGEPRGLCGFLAAFASTLQDFLQTATQYYI